MTRLRECDDCEYWQEGLSVGWLRNAIRGKRGQRLLRDLIKGLDSLPTPELSAGALEDPDTGCACALGVVRRVRGAENVPLWFEPDEEDIEPWDLAGPFDIPVTLAWEVVQQNEWFSESNDEQTRRKRWKAVRDWAVSNLSDQPS